MQTEIIKLSQVKINKANPRTISTDKFNKLVDSVLVFPKMLSIRPVVIDKSFTALGGNMRTQALKTISGFDVVAIQTRLANQGDYNKMKPDEQKALLAYWSKWLTDPTVAVIHAESLTAHEKQQFIIKDNSSFGQWDFDSLANSFDQKNLSDWGIDVWQMPKPQAIDPIQATTTPSAPTTSAPTADELDNTEVMAPVTNLPPELQGVDIMPAELPKIQGDDERAKERVIIVFDTKYKDDVTKLLGLASLDKVIYDYSELVGIE